MYWRRFQRPNHPTHSHCFVLMRKGRRVMQANVTQVGAFWFAYHGPDGIKEFKHLGAAKLYVEKAVRARRVH